MSGRRTQIRSDVRNVCKRVKSHDINIHIGYMYTLYYQCMNIRFSGVFHIPGCSCFKTLLAECLMRVYTALKPK